jgi:chromosome segregation ATPase
MRAFVTACQDSSRDAALLRESFDLLNISRLTNRLTIFKDGFTETVMQKIRLHTQIDDQIAEIAQLKAKNDEQSVEIAKLKAIIDTKDSVIRHLQCSCILESLRRTIDAQKREIFFKEDLIKSKNDLIRTLTEENEQFTKTIRDIKENFICGITHEIMEHPVITPIGVSYETDAIMDWLRFKCTDPLNPDILLFSGQLYNNIALRNIIEILRKVKV